MEWIPHAVFAAGVVLGEVYQWGNWLARNPGKPRTGYFGTGLPHLMMNLLVIVGVDVLWAAGLLDEALNFVIPESVSGAWANVGVPYTPQVGLLLGAMADLMGDQIAWLVRIVVGKRFPALAVPTQPVGGGSTGTQSQGGLTQPGG